jgi:hypothetical protein
MRREIPASRLEPWAAGHAKPTTIVPPAVIASLRSAGPARNASFMLTAKQGKYARETCAGTNSPHRSATSSVEHDAVGLLAR